MTNSLRCPIDDCRFHFKMIKGSLSFLRDHLFRDHDYVEKLETAVKLGVIKGLWERRSPKWLAERLAEKGVQ